MVWSGSPGTGMPHVRLARETERSFSPLVTKLTTSLRRLSGAIASGFLS